MNRPEAAVVAYRGAQELRPDLRSYQGMLKQSTDTLSCMSFLVGLQVLYLLSTQIHATRGKGHSMTRTSQ